MNEKIFKVVINGMYNYVVKHHSIPFKRQFYFPYLPMNCEINSFDVEELGIYTGNEDFGFMLFNNLTVANSQMEDKLNN